MSVLALLQAAAVQSTASARFTLWGDYSLADPLVLLVLPVALLLFWWSRARRARGRIGVVAPVSPSVRQRLAWIPRALQLAAIACAVIAMARPLRSNVELDTRAEGVDIALAIDRSGSMQFQDLQPEKSRLDVVKEVVGEFAKRRMSDRENAADSVALIAFAHYPRLLCPFTLDVDALQGFLSHVELPDPKRQDEDGTAIGVALAKAVAILKDSDAKSRICVLLTDGENNVNDITPADATKLAAEEHIKVYTIFAARYTYRGDPFSGRFIRTNEPVDTGPLESMAKETGGRFYRATDEKELEKIYAEIESLEKTPRKERRFEETYDLYPWLVIPALACAFLAQLSRSTWARRLP